ncbi:hypothetical protein [Sphingomonas japonica]|uniref:Scaffolding protein n=1 Tax=Sphingomonas japonica TaxID=511662 RepID=A0ABX0U7R1_9SPHN|nr:hypothetical protein [Sphingomonas japonica]NIJ24827.1 hypothetical protein [Sphingomonas japonica]
MAHPETEAVDAPVDDMDSAAAAIGKLMGGDDEPRDDDEDSEPDSEGEPEDGDLDLEGDEEEGEDDEPESPAIEAPASLSAEEKARYAQLPPEAQRLIAEVETRRNGQVQQATTKAAEAQRVAEARAAQADAQAKAVYAQQLKAFADGIAPQRPDPRLAQADPATYIAMQAQYEAARAQHDEFVQQVQSLESEAATQMTETEIAERNRALLAIPEVQNEETRAVFFEKAETAAKRIGLDIGELTRKASASELKALRDIADAFEKADKYDTAMTKQMQRVRDGRKVKTAKPNAAQPSSSEGRGYREARQRLSKSGDVRDAAAAIAGLR